MPLGGDRGRGVTASKKEPRGEKPGDLLFQVWLKGRPKGKATREKHKKVPHVPVMSSGREGSVRGRYNLNQE